MAFFFALPAWIWARWMRRNEAPLADALAFAALWFAQEMFRGWFLTGFPWLYSGYSQLMGRWQRLAPLGGMWLMGFVLALTAALLCNTPACAKRTQRFCRPVWCC
jgi:apolipoprotein N-acyltransferase